MSHHNQKDVKLLGEKIKGIRVAMMTTAEPDGTLRSRPMATQDMEFDGDLWFFTYADSPKVDEVQQHRQVNLAYVKPGDELYVSVSGTAQLVQDRKKMEDLWKPFLKAWFPKGLDDSALALLKVTVTEAEFWDAPSGKMVQIANMIKSMTTGERDTGGVDVKLDMK